MLHLKDGVFAEVDKALHLLLVATVADGGVEERLLRLLDLRLLPLVQLVLVDLEVNSLNLAEEHVMQEMFDVEFYFLRCFYLNPAQKGFKVVEDGPSGLQESENIKINFIV